MAFEKEAVDQSWLEALHRQAPPLVTLNDPSNSRSASRPVCAEALRASHRNRGRYNDGFRFTTPGKTERGLVRIYS